MMPNQNQKPISLSGSSSNKSRVFECSDHANSISKKLQSFYEKQQFLDIVLVAGVDNARLQAHRVVLSAASDFFLKMSSSPLQETMAGEVVLKEFDGMTMKNIIDFMYTGKIELHCKTVESILVAADFLQMVRLIDACCEFMVDHLDANNCLGIAWFAEQHSYYSLHKKASSFACAHFEEVCTHEEFLKLNCEQVEKFLSADDLSTRSEEKVFQSVVTWIEHDKEIRKKLVFNLLSIVRFTLLNPKFIIENRHLVCNTIECYELICSWLQWHLSPESRSECTTQKGKRVNRKLAFVSGESTRNFKVHTLNQESNTWSDEELPLPLKQRTEYAVTVIDKKLIITGGAIDDVETDSVECFDLHTKKWFDLPPMRIGRRLHGMAEFRRNLYVVGGYIDGRWSSSVEKYDFSTQEWEDVTPLNSSLEGIKIASGDRLFYAAGINNLDMEYYDLDTNKWTQMSGKNEKINCFGIAALGDYLYAAGGWHNGRRLPTVERYDSSTDTWSIVRSLKIPRDDVRCVALDNRIIACGGYNSRNWVNVVEEYDPVTDKWSALAPLPDALHYFRSSSSAVFTM